jgi:hypothetical protein
MAAIVDDRTPAATPRAACVRGAPSWAWRRSARLARAPNATEPRSKKSGGTQRNRVSSVCFNPNVSVRYCAYQFRQNMMLGAEATMRSSPRRTAGSPRSARREGVAGESAAAAAAAPARSITSRTAARPVTASHSGTHATPQIAVPTNAYRQLPVLSSSLIASGAAMVAPIELPVKSRPNPAERWPGGSTRRIVCAAPGNDGASAAPSATRIAKSAPKPGTSACAPETTDHASTATTRPRRAPTRSTTRPARGAQTRYAIENAARSCPSCSRVMPRASRTVGARTASVWRST